MPPTVDQLILDLLAKHEVTDQDGLLQLLGKRGHELTQSTLSRHLKKLGVRKHEGRYQRVEGPRAPVPDFTLLEAPPNLLVLRTAPGFAQALAALLDAHPPADVVGTLAGDDTIFIAVKGPEALQSAKAAVRASLAKG